MSISARQKKLVQDSFKKVVPISEQAADIFYKKLFEYDPSLKKLFKKDIKAQGKMLMTTLNLAVKGLDDLGKLVPVLQKLADAHIGYGVSVDDYTPVGNALIFTLKTGLGAEFTPETKDAWIATYTVIADTMRRHSYPDFDPSSYKNNKHYFN